MLIPPSIVYVRVQRPGRRPVPIVVPVLLLWPLLAVVEVGLLVLAAAASPFLVRRGLALPAIRLVPRLFELIAASRGLRVSLESEGTSLIVRLM